MWTPMQQSILSVFLSDNHLEIHFLLFSPFLVCFRTNPKSKHLSIGRKKFNMDPKKGIEYLIEHGLIENTPAEVAAFLHKGEGLNKTAIGDYLGERNDFNVDVSDVLRIFH